MMVSSSTLVRVTRVPVDILAPVTILLCFIGAYVGQGTFFAVVVSAVVGFVGYVMARCDYPRAPAVIGLILVPIAEKAFHQSLQISLGSYRIFYTRPLTLALLVFTLLALYYSVRQNRAAERERKLLTMGRSTAG
jgi:putative tricarboxylic transport membrane protein